MLVNIDAKGYGKIYKTVMRNRSLPLLAKTIYAYLCACAGCGDSAFPRRTAVMRELLTQLTGMLNRAANPDLLIRKIQGPEFEILFDELLSRWNDIRNPKAYVAAALKNL